MQGLTLPQSFLDRRLYHTFEDDFDHLNDADRYDLINSVVAEEVAGGRVNSTTGTTANNEAGFNNKFETLIMGKAFYWGTEVSFTDANANTGAIAVGLVDAAAAGLIINGGTDLRAGNIDGAIFLKKTGEAYWRVISQRGAAGTREENALIASNLNNLTRAQQAPSASRQRLEIEGLPVNDGFQIVFKIDGQIVAKHDNIDISSATEMQPVWFVKTSTTDAQTLYAYYNQGRMAL